MSFALIGLEALERALYCWEDALTAFSSTLGNDALALPSKADAAFTSDVQELLDMGYQIQSHAELLFLDQVQQILHSYTSDALLRKAAMTQTRREKERERKRLIHGP